MALDVSSDYRAFATHLLGCFDGQDQLRCLVVYVAVSDADDKPQLECIARWPEEARRLPDSPTDPELQVPEQARRWLPLQTDKLLLGALLVEVAALPWNVNLSQRLLGLAASLAVARNLDLRSRHLEAELVQLQRHQADQQQQLQALIHQMRNPLAALLTFTQLLRKRLASDDQRQQLVTGVLEEGEQIRRYLDILDRLPRQHLSGELELPRLLPPFRSTGADGSLQQRLPSLIRRAQASCEAAGRLWSSPDDLPEWHGDADAVAEILANLIENALRYASASAPIGLCWQATGSDLQLLVWDGGQPIPQQDRERIFRRGERGSTADGHDGTGFGLALGRQLARSLGGDLQLLINPGTHFAEAAAAGNGFLLRLPRTAQPQAAATFEAGNSACSSG